MSTAPQELSDLLASGPAEALIEAGLRLIADVDDPAGLRELAGWAMAASPPFEEDQRWGALHMLAGAAAARAAALATPPAAEGSEAGLLAACNDLQAELDAGLARAQALDAFAALGAWLLAHARSRYLDMKVRTDDDDTVFFWVSGVMALREQLSTE